MIKKDVMILNPSGLQVSAAGEFCDLAMEFSCKIHFKYRGDNEANAKSVLSVLGANIQNGEVIELICEGPDEADACESIIALLEKRFQGGHNE